MWSVLAWLAPAFGLGILASCIDIDSFFRERRISYTVRANGSFWLFVFLNGAASAAMLLWALFSEQESAINRIIQVETPWAKMLILAFGVPMLLRSKLFSFGKDEKAAGLAAVYEWGRLKTLRSINDTSAEKKDELATSYASKFAGRAGFTNTVKGWVDDSVRPFVTPSQQAELDRQYNAIQASYAGASHLTEEHFKAVIRWAMDTTDFRHIKRRLDRLA